MLINIRLSEGGSQRKKRLSRTRLACQSDQLDIRIVEHLEGKTLLGVARLDAKVGALLHPFDLAREGIETSHDAVALALQDETLVGLQLGVDLQQLGLNALRGGVDLVDQLRVDPLIGLMRPLENIDIDHFVVDVILHGDA